MNLLILDGPPDPQPGRNPVYRGTYREHPYHCDELPDDSEINKLFFWFLGEGDQLGVVHDLAKALRLAELWNKRRETPDHFEVVEVADGSTRPQNNGNFIGFDLSAGYSNSLLYGGLKKSAGGKRLSEPIEALLDLLCLHFGPQLNVQGLFQTLEVASHCRRSMIALQDLSPNLFEGGDLRQFKPVGLYIVDSNTVRQPLT